jgi:hypothetical protein
VRLRRLSVTTTAIIYVQIVLGAAMRHTGAGLAIPDFPLAFGHVVPPTWTQAIAIHFAHRVGALVAATAVLTIAGYVWRVHRSRVELRRPAVLAVAIVAAQITLGALTVLSGKAVVFNTAHVVTGALLLATSLVLTARIPASPAIVGTEVLGPRGELSVRTRFGIMPPAPLSGLKSGEIAISDPVLTSTPESSNGPDVALGQMLGSTVVRANKIGVYWETYGYAAGDSVDVAVIISRHEPLSKFRRLGMKLRVAHDINGSVAVRWTEPKAGHDSWTIPSRVPIQARAVGLDLSRLEPGHYRVQVLAGRAGGVPVTASRDFVLEQP